MGRGLRKDNRGISLVEVMVVIAIIVVVGAVGIMSVNAMSGKPAQQCAQQVVYSLEKHRTSAMGKVKAEYVMSVDSSTNKIIAKEYLSNSNTYGDPKVYELGAAGIKVTYVTGDGVTHDLATEPLTLQFERSSGAFKKLASGQYCNKIIIERGGRTHEVTLVPLTGKVYID